MDFEIGEENEKQAVRLGQGGILLVYKCDNCASVHINVIMPGPIVEMTILSPTDEEWDKLNALVLQQREFRDGRKPN